MSARKKTETPAEPKFTITLNERQLRLLQKVCEEYGRWKW